MGKRGAGGLRLPPGLAAGITIMSGRNLREGALVCGVGQGAEMGRQGRGGGRHTHLQLIKHAARPCHMLRQLAARAPSRVQRCPAHSQTLDPCCCCCCCCFEGS